jgi:TRAP-type C4-dicarboxylate transport system permease small subunit
VSDQTNTPPPSETAGEDDGLVSRLLELNDRVANVVGVISALFLAGIAVLVLSEIGARAVFNYSLSFSWEYSAFFMAIAFFCGASFTLRSGGHVRVSLLSSSVPPRVAWMIDVFATVCGVVITVYMTYAFIQFTAASFASGSVSATTSRTPLVIPQAAISFGLVLFTIQMIARLIRLLTGRPTESAMEGSLSVTDS